MNKMTKKDTQTPPTLDNEYLLRLELDAYIKQMRDFAKNTPSLFKRFQIKRVELRRKGVLHKVGSPAVTNNKTSIEYWLIGKLHRTGEPAVITTNGTKLWYTNDKLHRENGPAIEYPDGSEEYWLNGELHRIDGPAVIYTPTGQEEWRINHKLHREDGPAFIAGKNSPEKRWYYHGKLHNNYGPAVIDEHGLEEWWLNGEESSPPTP